MNVRSQHGMVQGNITRLETNVVNFENQETLTENEQQSVPKNVKKLEALSTEFKKYHCSVSDQIKDQDNWLKNW